MSLWEKLFKKPESKPGEEGLDERMEEYKTEADLEKKTKDWQEEEKAKKKDRAILHKAAGAQKATKEQIEKIRTDISEGKEEIDLEDKDIEEIPEIEPDEIELEDKDIEEVTQTKRKKAA